MSEWRPIAETPEGRHEEDRIRVYSRLIDEPIRLYWRSGRWVLNNPDGDDIVFDAARMEEYRVTYWMFDEPASVSR